MRQSVHPSQLPHLPPGLLTQQRACVRVPPVQLDLQAQAVTPEAL
ncbi:hypothetical protein E2C01_083025 [Portunus trituberculatus]|uniref:Uncharacterized protein n=1 Tax=Portunus trituberculatus TaxID=210409 RepID=A0A5B7IW34_PORTR|nr:hypothetical protein [Portunus trituberculatus]